MSTSTAVCSYVKCSNGGVLLKKLSCSNCRTPYCSVDCQTKHWKKGDHKLYCNDMKERRAQQQLAEVDSAGVSKTEVTDAAASVTTTASKEGTTEDLLPTAAPTIELKPVSLPLSSSAAAAVAAAAPTSLSDSVAAAVGVEERKLAVSLSVENSRADKADKALLKLIDFSYKPITKEVKNKAAAAAVAAAAARVVPVQILQDLGLTSESKEHLLITHELADLYVGSVAELYFSAHDSYQIGVNFYDINLKMKPERRPEKENEEWDGGRGGVA